MTVFFYFFITKYPIYEGNSFKAFNNLILFSSVLNTLTLFRKAVINSFVISVILILFTAFFYLNSFFEIVDSSFSTFYYMSSLAFISVIINLHAFYFSVEVYRIENLEKFPKFDCIELDAFMFDNELIYNSKDTYGREFAKFKIYYNNFYVYEGNIYYGERNYVFWDIYQYAKSQNIEMNKLTYDDFKLIDMINI